MAYNPAQMSALCFANGFTLWHYRTDDTLSAVYSGGYFDRAASMVRIGDMIIVNAMKDGKIQPANPTVVKASRDKVVIGY
jgi:hypothetical protein